MAVLLLDNGWNPKAVDNNNETPSKAALSNGNTEIAWVIEHFKSGAPSVGIEPEFLNFISQVELDYLSEWPTPETLDEAVAMVQVPGVENAVRQSRTYWNTVLSPQRSTGADHVNQSVSIDAHADADDEEEAMRTTMTMHLTFSTRTTSMAWTKPTQVQFTCFPVIASASGSTPA